MFADVNEGDAASVFIDDIALFELDSFIISSDVLPTAASAATTTRVVPEHVAVDSGKRAATARSTPRMKCMTPKEQIESLRHEVSRLEQQLSDWRAFWKQSAALAPTPMRYKRQRPDGSDTSTATASATQYFPWASIAAERQRELTVAQCTNRDLREQIDATRKLLRSMRKFVRRRAADAAHLQRELVRAMPLDHPQSLRESSNSTAAFQALLTNTFAMLHSFETVEKAAVAHHHQQREINVFRIWTVEHDPRDGSFLKMLDRYAVPFEPRAVASALLRISTKRERAGQVSEFFRATDDGVVLHQLFKRYEYPTARGHVREHHAVCSHTNETDTLVALSRLTDVLRPSGASVSASSRLLAKTWIRIAACPLTATPDRPVTVIQTYSTMAFETMTLPSDLSPDARAMWTPANLRATLVPILDAGVTDAQHTLENELIQSESIGPSMSSTL